MAPGDRQRAPLASDEVIRLLGEQRRALTGLAVSILRDGAAAQDAVQDVIEAILRRELTFADEAAALRYARTALVNRCRSMQRRAGTARRHLGRLLSPPAPQPDEAILLADEHRHLLELFYRLPEKQREALTLRHFADLPDEEIAASLGTSVSAVRSNISRGLAALAQLLKENPHE